MPFGPAQSCHLPRQNCRRASDTDHALETTVFTGAGRKLAGRRLPSDEASRTKLRGHVTQRTVHNVPNASGYKRTGHLNCKLISNVFTRWPT